MDTFLVTVTEFVTDDPREPLLRSGTTSTTTSQGPSGHVHHMTRLSHGRKESLRCCPLQLVLLNMSSTLACLAAAFQPTMMLLVFRPWRATTALFDLHRELPNFKPFLRAFHPATGGVCVCVETLFPRVFSSRTAFDDNICNNSRGRGAWIAGLPLTKTPAFRGDVFWDARTCTCSL